MEEGVDDMSGGVSIFHASCSHCCVTELHSIVIASPMHCRHRDVPRLMISAWSAARSTLFATLQE